MAHLPPINDDAGPPPGDDGIDPAIAEFIRAEVARQLAAQAGGPLTGLWVSSRNVHAPRRDPPADADGRISMQQVDDVMSATFRAMVTRVRELVARGRL